MKDSARYAKIVEWSEVDQVYIGTVPGFIYGGCHGDDELAVFAELCEIAEENIALYHSDGVPLPPPTINGNLPTVLRERAVGFYGSASDFARDEEAVDTLRKLAV
jgi:hypothetical protein